MTTRRALRCFLCAKTLLIALLIQSAGSVQPIFGQAPCTPPDSMKARFQDKPDAAAYTDLGVWFADQKKYDCAAEAFATSMQMAPDQKDVAHVAFMFGVSLYFSGDTKEAIISLQEAEQLGYRDLKLHIILATALDSSHSTKDAEEEWRAALEFDPESSIALDALSNDLLAERDFNGIIAALEVPRLHGQRTPQQALNLAGAYAGMARPDDATRVLRDGLNTTPDSIALADQLARTLMQLNHKDEAVTVLKLALEQHPDAVGPKALLAELQNETGAGK
jgi:Flp pilus assembly protein TadD